MTGSRRRAARTTRLLAGAATLAVALTACGDGDEQAQQTPTEAPTAWTTAGAANPSDKPGETGDRGQAKVGKLDALQVSLPEGGKSAMVDPNTWPDIQTLLNSDQLKGIFPSLSLGNPRLCAFGTYNSVGGLTPKNTQCSWEVKRGVIGSDAARFRLQLRGIGADSEVVKSWDGVRQTYRGENAAGDNFYVDGTYGARRVLLRQSGLGSFVVSDGEVAAWFDVSMDDNLLNQDDPAKNNEAVRTQAFPTLVETFVTLLPRKF